MSLLPLLPAKYKGHLALLAAGIIALSITAVTGEHGLFHLLKLQDEQQNLERIVFHLQQNNEHQRDRIARLQSDDRYIERIARDRLGLVGQGEIVYRLRSAPIRPR
ncbi:MAG: septum formation initiator family protein [Deltaproteobacteria bacterium]|nr:septum formation initiator family protein [Deltaproteobacteria bacterium]